MSFFHEYLNKQIERENRKYMRNIISFLKYVGVAMIMWVLTTLTLKLGLYLSINLWLITLFNIGFYGILKWILYKVWEVFK